MGCLSWLEIIFLLQYCKLDYTGEHIGTKSFFSLYLEDLKKGGDPFKKIHISKLQNSLKSKAEELKYSLTEKTSKIKERNKKIVTRTFNKIGLVVPYNRK